MVLTLSLLTTHHTARSLPRTCHSCCLHTCWRDEQPGEEVLTRPLDLTTLKKVLLASGVSGQCGGSSSEALANDGSQRQRRTSWTRRRGMDIDSNISPRFAVFFYARLLLNRWRCAGACNDEWFNAFPVPHSIQLSRVLVLSPNTGSSAKNAINRLSLRTPPNCQ